MWSVFELVCYIVGMSEALITCIPFDPELTEYMPDPLKIDHRNQKGVLHIGQFRGELFHGPNPEGPVHAFLFMGGAMLINEEVPNQSKREYPIFDSEFGDRQPAYKIIVNHNY